MAYADKAVLVQPSAPAIAPQTQATPTPVYGKVPRSSMSPITVQYPFAIQYGADREAVVYDCVKGPVGVCVLPGDVYNVPVRVDLLWQMARWYRAMVRQGTHREKGWGEVFGSNRKPWPQKGTGRARHGTRRSPLFKGGGNIHPIRPKSYAYQVYVRTQRAALKCALSAKANERRLLVVDHLRCGGDPARLRDMLTELLFKQHNQPRLNALLVDAGEHDSHDGGRRLRGAGDKVGKGVTVRPYHQTNVYELLRHDVVVMTRKAADKVAAALRAPLDRLGMHNYLAVFGKPLPSPLLKNSKPLPLRKLVAASLPGHLGFVPHPLAGKRILRGGISTRYKPRPVQMR